MVLSKTIYFYSGSQEGLLELERLLDGVTRPKEGLTDLHDFRGKIEGGQAEIVVFDARELKDTILAATGEPEPERLLGLSLAELEKRHILRVLASTGGNKTRAARILGIDTKTLYNKLKSYQVGQKARSNRREGSEQTTV